jgi:hypothetical protein
MPPDRGRATGQGPIRSTRAFTITSDIPLAERNPPVTISLARVRWRHISGAKQTKQASRSRDALLERRCEGGSNANFETIILFRHNYSSSGHNLNEKKH